MKKILISTFLIGLTAWTLVAQKFVPAGSISMPSEYEIKNLEDLNSNQIDYSAVPFRNGVVFTSTRSRTALFGCSNDFTNGHYSDLYYAESDGEGNYQTPALLEGDLSGKYHDGTASFTSDQTRMFFSRNNRKGPNGFGTIDLKIYESTIKHGYWTDVKELPFNSNDFATCHPSITPNGTWLYFSSDRPGGYGGMDIYVAEKKRNGQWGAPVNLGPKVNTPGNELFPFISPQGILYWSSNGFDGMGGLDIYSLPISNGDVADRAHLTPPINSEKDDFGFTTNFQGTEGFLTSNREGGNGKDDLYSWRFLGQKPKMAHLCVVDERNGDRIYDAFLELTPEAKSVPGQDNLVVKDGITYLQMEATEVDGKEYLILVPYDERNKQPVQREGVGKSCNVHLPILPGRMYEIIVDKPGYMPLRRMVSAAEILAHEEYLIPISVKPPIAMRGEVKDKKNNEPIPFADINVRDKCTQKMMEFTADRQGRFTFPMDCNCDYEITANKGNYREDYEVVYSYDIQCENDDNTAVLLYLERTTPNRASDEPDFTVGRTIRLDKLYYDYDKHYIRPDAAVELDKVVNYMKKYPTLEIELGSHTDARGSDEYNRDLSQRRAQAAVDYIISKGISVTRITARGYGEYILVNRCRNGVNCSDAEHQDNRRTEIKVTRFDEKGVRIED
ncbi:MAG: OmpA family protein [Bacteroidota bacterium]